HATVRAGVPITRIIPLAFGVLLERRGAGDWLTVAIEDGLADLERVAGNANQALDVILLLRPGHAPVKVLQVVRPEDETVSDFRTDKVITHPVDEQLVTGQDVECQDTFPALNVLP